MKKRLFFNLDLVEIFRSVGMDKEADMIEDGTLEIRPYDPEESKRPVKPDESGRLRIN